MPDADRKNKKRNKEMESGQVLEILATDKGAKADLVAWAKSGGHELLDSQENGDVFTFWIKKG